MTVAVAFAWTATLAQAAPFVYVTNYLSSNVSQYDVEGGGLLTPLLPATVPIGPNPWGVAVGPDGRSVYVTSFYDGTVSQFDVGTGGNLSPKNPATVPSGIEPGGLAVSPDGRSVYVATLIGLSQTTSARAGP